MRRLLLALALALPLVGARVAVADVAEPVAEGIALYDDLEYEAAAKALRAALAEKKLPAESRVAGYQYLGLALVALGRENEARDAFRKLLEIDRRFVLPDTFNPKARDLLEEVRGDLASDVTMTESVAPRPGRADSPVTIALTLEDKSAVARSVILYYRVGDAVRYSSIQASRESDGTFIATISGAFIAPPSVSYYVEALAVDGRRLARIGSAAKPRSFDVEKAKTPSRSIFASPWLWAGVGLAAAGGVAAFFLLQPDDVATGSILIEPTSAPALRF